MNRSAAGAWLLTVGVLAIQLSPLTRGERYDSFPWSTYPMFAHGRPDAVTVVDQVVAVAADKTTRRVPPRLIANDEVLQAAATLRYAVRRGKKSTRALCRQVAARAAADPGFADARTLELVTVKYDALRYFDGDTAPLGKPHVRARCKVPR